MTDLQFKVRALRTEDLARLLPLRCALWPDTPLQEHEQALRLRIEGGVRYEIFLLEHTSGEVCGFAELMREVNAPGEAPQVVALQAIYVAPNRRRNGGATMLLEAANRWSHSRGAQQLSVRLPAEHASMRESSTWLGFENEQNWVSSHRKVRAPLQIPAPASDKHMHTAQDDLLPAITIQRRTHNSRALVINGALLLIAVVCFAFTDIYSKDAVRGLVLPFVDGVFVIYFLFLFMAARFRKRTDSNARADQLFRVDD